MCAVLHDDGQALANKFVGALVVAGNDLLDIDSPFESIPKHGGRGRSAAAGPPSRERRHIPE